jgi:shikimate dehydrogenase
MPRLGVAGWPVAHSRSPVMFAAAFDELGMADWSYQRLPLPPALFAETVRALPGAGFAGINVTIPHKEAALALADEASPVARAIGAANTLRFGADGTFAENTDAPGLLRALGTPVAGMDALVLGAGGSARAVVWALLSAGARDVAIWGRTLERTQRLADELGGRAVRTLGRADLLVNCTPVGLEQPSSSSATHMPMGLTPHDIRQYPYVVDLVYRDGGTALLGVARAHGATTVDGLEMLVQQGALSFELWTGRSAPLPAMRAAAEMSP